jgi:hypothetical protein
MPAMQASGFRLSLNPHMNTSDRQWRFALFSRRVNEANHRQSWRGNENTDFPLGSPAGPRYQRVMKEAAGIRISETGFMLIHDRSCITSQIRPVDCASV